MATDAAAKLAAEVYELKRQVRALSTTYQLGRSSLTDGTTLPDIIQSGIRVEQLAAQAVKDAASALAKADGVVVTYYTDDGTPPTGASLGDFWFRRDTKDVYSWDDEANGGDGGWIAVTSTEVKAALAAAAAAEAAADGKISTWFRPTAPAVSDGVTVGDIWFDTDDKNKQYRWDGTSWAAVQDGRIQNAIDAAAAANSAAITALTAGNGSNQVVYATYPPDSTSPAGTKVGDVWYVRDQPYGGYITAQYMWDGQSWTAQTLTNVTVTSITAGAITTGTLSSGVSITVGVPGGRRMVLAAAYGFRAYDDANNLFFSVGDSGIGARVIADSIASSGVLSGGASYVRIGNLGDGDAVDGIKLIRPSGSQVTFRNTSNGSGGTLDIDFRNSSNISQGGFVMNANGIQSKFSFMTLGAASNGSISVGNGLSLSASGSNIFYDATNHFMTGNMTFNPFAGGNMSFSNSFDGNNNPRVGRVGVAHMKFAGDGVIQARFDYDPSGYTYLRGIIQDQSNPDLKENITEIRTDALAELSTVKRYAYDWKREARVPFAQPARDSSTGLLLSEIPWSVQQYEDGYATGSYLALLTSAVNQLHGMVRDLTPQETT